MRNTLFLLVVLLVASGCSNNPSDNLDVENSPCACLYDGSQLETTPTNRELKEIAELQFFEVA